ncbi:MAG TPA: hypothetical protein VFE62_01615 [Gemmataceae bacterium]|nr:hypothetical protein [Gemmataceae bacterium]
MKRLTFASLAVLSMLAVVSIADAGGCVVRQRAVYQHADYVAPAIVAQFVPVPVVPLYSFGYGDSGRIDKLEGQVKDLQIEQLKDRVARLEAQQQKPLPPVVQPSVQPSPPAPLPAKAQAPAEHPGLTVLRNSCVKCHDSTVAKGKGGGLVLFNAGAFVAQDCKTILAVTHDVYSGRMPQGAKLSDADVGEVMAFLDSIKGSVK